MRWSLPLAIAVALVAAPALAQGPFWTQVYKFGPDTLDGPRVLELASVPGALLAGVLRSPGGLQRSADGGHTWTGVELDHPHVEGFAVGEDGAVYGGIYGSGVHRSDDGGTTWGPSALPTPLVWAVSVAQNGAVLAGTLRDGLFSSVDEGLSWAPVSPAWDVRAVAAAPGVLLIARSGAQHTGSEHRSTDGGASWEEVDVLGTVYDLAVSPTGPFFAVGSSGVSRSSDGGSWEVVRAGSGSRIQITASGEVYVAAGGVYRSLDGGSTWEDVSAGLTGEAVSALTVESEGHIYAATIHGRVFRSTSPVATPAGPAWAEHALEVWPNPSSAAVHVMFTLREAATVDLAVYDVLGRRVTQLASGTFTAGRHRVEWRPADGEHGHYVLRLTAPGRFVQSVPVVRL